MTSEQLMAQFIQTKDGRLIDQLVARHEAELVEWISNHYIRDMAAAQDLARQTFAKIQDSSYDGRPFVNWLRWMGGNCAINYPVSKRQPEPEQPVVMLNSIPDLERRVITLLYYQDMTESEAAQQLGIPRHQLRKLLRAGLAKLKRHLDSLDAIDRQILFSVEKCLSQYAVAAQLAGQFPVSRHEVCQRIAKLLQRWQPSCQAA